MTVLCAGGASAPVNSNLSTLVMGAGPLAALADLSGWGVLADALALLGAVAYDITAICATDPPAQPTFTLAELLALTTVQPSTDFESGLGKLKDLVENLVWFQNCNCVSGPQPALPPAQTFPSVSIAPNASVCQQLVTPTTSISYGGAGNTALTGPFRGTFAVNPGGVGSTWCLPLPSGWTGLEQICTVSNFVGAGNIGAASMWQYSANGTFLGATALSGSGYLTSNGVQTNWNYAITPLANATQYVVWGTAQNPGETADLQLTLNFYCGHASPTQAAGCCGPDTTNAALLAQIYSLVQLVQRQLAPFAYVAGANHVGLTGAGEIPVQGLLGVKITPSAIPTWAGVAAGDPDTLWLDSWINWGNADGWTAREFLRSSPHLSFPPLAGQFTKVGYSFAAGISCDVLELQREP